MSIVISNVSKMIVPQPPLLQSFYDFCDEQPKDKKIEHKTWNSCAIGEFYGDVDAWYSTGLVSSILGDREWESEINLHHLVDFRKCPNTYGEFTEFLKPYLGIEV